MILKWLGMVTEGVGSRSSGRMGSGASVGSVGESSGRGMTGMGSSFWAYGVRVVKRKNRMKRRFKVGGGYRGNGELGMRN